MNDLQKGIMQAMKLKAKNRRLTRVRDCAQVINDSLCLSLGGDCYKFIGSTNDVDDLRNALTSEAFSPTVEPVPSVPNTNIKKPQIGSIISGTLREEDLLEAFANELESLSDAEQNLKLIIYARAIDPNDMMTPTVVEDLSSALDSLAPSYMYFGALEGDGSDFGFWPDLEALKTSVFDGDTLQVNDICDIPADYTGEIMLVNDHGNVTFGYVKEPGEGLITVWSCV